ncbi:MAG TPA: heme A synthase [Thermomicrobiaceae bacterium]|nr:heme A synthase [Thermomicrobiaceae bacterium]
MGDWRGVLAGEAAGRAARWLAVTATAGMFVVLIMGATVTNTGSAQGCGRSWPLCHGQFIPSFAVSTAIEFSHRAVTGIETVLILGLALLVWLGWRGRREARILVPAMVFFLVLQAGLGAWAVLYPQLPEVLALHFGVSLTAFASVLLTAVFLLDLRGAEVLRDRPIPVGLRRLVWGAFAYTYLLVYLGAYVSHTNASLACTGWPLCNGQVFPGFSGPVGIVFAHRLAALVGVGLVAWLARWTWRLRAERPDLARGAALSLILILAQALSGALVVLLRLDLFSTLLHAGLVSLLFGGLSYLCYHILPRPTPVVATEPSAEPAVVLGAGARPR